MTTVTNVLGTQLAAIQTGPSAAGYSGFPALSAGEGAPAYLKSVEDQLPWSTTMGSAAANYGTFLVFPTNAIVKKFELAWDAIPDVNATQALIIEFGIAFSAGGVRDGTPSSHQGMIPTTAKDGTETTFAAHSTANAFFGSHTPVGNNTNPLPEFTDFTLNGNLTTWPALTRIQTPLLELFGYTMNNGIAIEEMGYFVVYAYVTHAYGTVPAAALNLLGKLEFAAI